MPLTFTIRGRNEEEVAEAKRLLKKAQRILPDGNTENIIETLTRSLRTELMTMPSPEDLK